MQYQFNAGGKRIYPSDFKKRILAELEQGRSPNELAREFQIPLQNIFRWKRVSTQGKESSYDASAPAAMVPLSEHEKIVAELELELKRAKKSLANMTVDRDILKEAVSIASKKKWI